MSTTATTNDNNQQDESNGTVEPPQKRGVPKVKRLTQQNLSDSQRFSDEQLQAIPQIKGAERTRYVINNVAIMLVILSEMYLKNTRNSN